MQFLSWLIFPGIKNGFWSNWTVLLNTWIVILKKPYNIVVLF